MNNNGEKINPIINVVLDGDKGFYNNYKGIEGVMEDLNISENEDIEIPIETECFKLMADIETKYGIMNKGLKEKEDCLEESYKNNVAWRAKMKETTGKFPEETIIPIRKDKNVI